MKLLVATKREGRLGNRLFLCANILAFGFEIGAPVSLLALAEYAELFENFSRSCFLQIPQRTTSKLFGLPRSMRIAHCEMMGLLAKIVAKVRGFPWLRAVDIRGTWDAEDRAFALNTSEMRQLASGAGLLLLHGWKFRAGRELLQKWREHILRVLKPIHSVEERAARAVEQARQNGQWLVGVHIRRGDYQQWLGGRYFFELENYVEWMRQAKSLFKDKQVCFLVCSNEPWRRGDFSELKEEVAFGPGDATGDLYALSRCDCIVGPPSTYTLWASYAGGKPLHIVEQAQARLWLGGFTFHDGP